MSPERLAEMQKFALETIPEILKQKREPQTERALFSTGPALAGLMRTHRRPDRRARKG